MSQFNILTELNITPRLTTVTLEPGTYVLDTTSVQHFLKGETSKTGYKFEQDVFFINMMTTYNNKAVSVTPIRYEYANKKRSDKQVFAQQAQFGAWLRSILADNNLLKIDSGLSSLAESGEFGKPGSLKFEREKFRRIEKFITTLKEKKQVRSISAEVTKYSTKDGDGNNYKNMTNAG
tara:strand:- start:1880 stop:2413 length:534 start_codon:yes stop_codon:yes gene_type:complete